MSVFDVAKTKNRASSERPSTTSTLIRILITLAVDVGAGWLALNFWSNGVPYLAAVIAAIAVLWTWVLLRKEAYPIRWMVIGLTMMILFAIYPIFFTIYVAFTNFGDGHLLAKDQAIVQIEKETYLPEGKAAFTWTAFRAADGSFALWLQQDSNPGMLAKPDEPITTPNPGDQGVGEFDENGIPVSIEGYDRLNKLTVLRYMNDLGNLRFGVDEQIVQITSTEAASEREPLYRYDAEQDRLVNQETGEIFVPIEGTFTGQTSGKELIPGFQTTVGFGNFQRFFTSPALRGPLLRIILWNFAFAFLSVVMTFALGLAIAYLFNDPEFPGKKIIQSLLLIPYTIPSLITILIWRGLMNPDVGIINRTLSGLIGFSPPWFTDQWWAKMAILIVNLWLGYPYFMLICSGALQAIPQDIYAAAEVDGANGWQRFRLITLPLLLVAVGPLMVASFTFNFNNFNLIYLFISGGPPIAGTISRAGHTDILISYVYNLAFAGGRGADYGLASAITIVIFVIVAAITLAQFRWTRMWEEVSENV
ncbi:MAG: maltose ABC transporter permease MalF [Ardenticatenales bacterium]|nr:maltose ABC transporter permease MalF [Ardenticatenales bacterium]